MTACASQHYDLAGMSLEEKLGQLIIARYIDWPLEDIETFAKSGWITGLTPRQNDKSLRDAAEYLNHLQSVSKYPLLFGWGGIHFTGGTDLRLDQAMRIGATRSKELAFQAGRIEAIESRAVGFHVTGYPVLDVNTNPDNPIINLRSLSDNVELVVELGLEIARGILDGRALSNGAHFPGHGHTGQDSHIEIAISERTLEQFRQIDLRPFQAAFDAGVIKFICTNHCYYPALEPTKSPATVSRRLIHDLARNQMGYDQVIMSDSLTMRAMKHNYGIEESAIWTVLAGHDVILQDYESDPRITLDALVRAVKQGRIPLAQIDESVRRVMEAKRWLGLFENRLVDVERLPQLVGTAEHKAVARRIARESVTCLEDRGLPLPGGNSVKCCLISNGSVATVEEDMGITHIPANEYLRQQLVARVPAARACVVGIEPQADEIQAALELAKGCDVVIFGLLTRVRSYAEHGIRLHPAYRDLIRQVVAMGRRVVYLNLGNPWMTVDLPRPDISLCAYSDAQDSIEASLGVAFGEIKPAGRLPVTLSVEYPFGFCRTGAGKH